MKNISIYILLIALIFSGCRKEEVILDDPTTTIEPPKVEDGAFFSGKVQDPNGAGVLTEIEVYQDGDLIGTVNTDIDGTYNTLELPIVLGSEITFGIEEESFASKYKRVKPQVESNENLNFRLIPNVDNPVGEDRPLVDPGSSELVKVFGTFTDINGEPIVNAHTTILYDIEILGENSFYALGSYDLSDENGYVEFLAPKNKDLYYFSTPNDISNGLACYSYINETETYDVIKFFGMDALGKLTEDTEIIEQPNLSLVRKDYLFLGDFLNCDGTPVQNGEVKMRITYMANGKEQVENYSSNEFDENGEYVFNLAFCSNEVDVELEAITDDGYKAEIDFTSPLGGVHLAPLKACEEDNDPEFLISTMDLRIGTDLFFEDITFVSGGFDAPYDFSVVGQHPALGFVNFDIQNMQVGASAVPVRQLVVDYLDPNPEPYAFASYNGELTALITKIDNGIIEGVLAGNVETYGIGTQNINGSFTIRYDD